MLAGCASVLGGALLALFAGAGDCGDVRAQGGTFWASEDQVEHFTRVFSTNFRFSFGSKHRQKTRALRMRGLEHSPHIGAMPTHVHPAVLALGQGPDSEAAVSSRLAEDANCVLTAHSVIVLPYNIAIHFLRRVAAEAATRTRVQRLQERGQRWRQRKSKRARESKSKRARARARARERTRLLVAVEGPVDGALLQRPDKRLGLVALLVSECQHVVVD